jgi:DNA-binding NtrC family response regulator
VDGGPRLDARAPAVFRAYLSVTRSARSAPPDASHHSLVTNPAPLDAAPRRLLLVDDEDAIRSALRRLFARRGWIVHEAADGERALECLLGGEDPVPYDAVISDMRMPRLTGEQVHDALQAARPQLLARCIFSTGDVSAPEAASFLERTRCRVLEKPFELAQLVALVEALPPRHA